MKLILLGLLLTSCSTRKPLVSNDEAFFYKKVEACMEKFSNHGFNADGIVKICQEVFNRKR